MRDHPQQISTPLQQSGHPVTAGTALYHMGHCRRWGKQLWRECWRLWCWWWCCAGSSRAGCSGNSFVEALNSDQVFSENLCSREPELSKTIFVVCGMPVFQIIRRRIIFNMILKKIFCKTQKKHCKQLDKLEIEFNRQQYMVGSERSYLANSLNFGRRQWSVKEIICLCIPELCWHTEYTNHSTWICSTLNYCIYK